MLRRSDAASRADQIAALLEERLGIRGRGLDAKLARAGRALPRWVRREAETLAQAAQFSENPKMIKRIDHGSVERAFRKCEAYLETVDPVERRKDRLLGFLAVNAFNLGLLAALLLGLLAWRGFL